jgi:hypothetical protein
LNTSVAISSYLWATRFFRPVRYFFTHIHAGHVRVNKEHYSFGKGTQKG